MPDKLQELESKPAAIERRAGPRFRATSLIYAKLDKGNGGIVTCISESGLALTPAAILEDGAPDDELRKMRIQLPGFEGGIETSGQIVWKNASRKEAAVRFVDLGENAREQIRTWIAAQISKDGSRPNQAALPSMQLPTSKAKKARGPRFSFADVASSRVDGEDDIVADLSEGIAEAGAFPSNADVNDLFGDPGQAASSVLDGPAFADEQNKEEHSAREEQQTQSKLEEDGEEQPLSPIRERRRHPRRKILLFTYAVLGEDNGGLVFSLSEGGMALTAATSLRDDHFAKMRVRFPDSEDWIETKGRLAWVCDSGKEAGVQFVDLPEQARLRIREWASAEEVAVEFHGEQGEALRNPLPPPDAPIYEGQEEPFSEPGQPKGTLEEQLRAPAAPTPAALFASGIKGVLARVSVRKRVARIKLPRGPKRGVKGSGRIARSALVSAAVVIMVVAGWNFLQRSSLNGARGSMAQNIPPNIPNDAALNESTKTEAPPASASERAIAGSLTKDSPVSLAENGAASESEARITPSPKSKPEVEDSLRRADRGARASAANPASHKTNPPRGNIPSAREQKARPVQWIAPAPVPALEKKSVANQAVANKSAENKPLLTAKAVPVLSKNNEINAPPPSLNLSPIRAEAASAGEMKEEKLLVASKQPEPPVARTGIVTVSFDPYPSIRLPTSENSKKSRQGKSLQMGHLLTRVEPIYPEEAKQQGIEGAVKVHAIFTKEGTVQSLIEVSGPPPLVPAAMNAVRQWRYSQTVLGGQAMETEEDVTVLFRLSNQASKN